MDNLGTTTTDSASWIAERERRGAARVEMDTMFGDAVVVLPVSTSRPIAEPCVEMYEFIAAASRSAVDVCNSSAQAATASRATGPRNS